MASSYVNDLRLNEMATGDASGTWGDTTNTNLELIAEAFSYGTEAITTNADTHTTTIADGATDPGRSMFLKYTGTLDSTCTITIGPNTVSKLWIIENGTSGSQSIIIKQGSGATITIPSGKTKVIYSDGAGSGGAMVDAFASLNLQTSGIIETSASIQTALIEYTDGDDAMTIADGGGVTFAQTATFSDDIIIGDGKTIGSASDVDAMTIASNGQVTFTQTLIGTALDISGNIDVDGTTNLDVVDIDGAVDMASTLNVSGAITGTLGTAAQPNITSLGTLTTLTVDDITINGSTISDGAALTLDAATEIFLDSDSGYIYLKDDGTSIGLFKLTSSDFYIKSVVSDKDIIFQGNDGGSAITALTLDMSAAGAATFNTSVLLSGVGGLTTTGGNNLTVSGSVADHAGLVFATHAILPAEAGANASPNVIDLGANGNEFKSLYLNTSIITDTDLTLDVGGDIIFNADGGDWKFQDGAAGILEVQNDGNGNAVLITTTSDKDMRFLGNDGGSTITALTLDMSDAGTAIFNSYAKFSDNQRIVMGAGTDLSIYSDGTDGNIDGAAKIKLDAVDEIHLDADAGIIRIQDDAGDVGMFQMTNSDFIVRSMTSDKDLIFKGNDGGSVITALTLDMSDAGAATFNSSVIIPQKLIHSGDTDTYLNFDTNLIDIYAGGVLGIRVQPNAVTINEASADYDFRVESNGNTHMLFVDGGNDRVGIGRSAPASIFEVHIDTNKNIGYSGGQGELGSIPALVAYNDAGSLTDIGFRGTTVRFASTNQERMRIDETGVVANEGSHDADFRVESNNNAAMLFVDGGNDRVGIGTNAPTDPLTIHDGTPSIKFKDTSSNGEAFWSLDGTSMSLYNKSTGGSMAFGTANTERMKLLGTGNLSLALGVPLQATADGRAVNTSVGTSFVTILDFSTIGGTNAGTGFYLVTVVREGASVGTSINLLVGVSGSGLVIIYDTIQATGLSAQASNAQIQVKQPSGGTVECHATAIPVGITGHDS